MLHRPLDPNARFPIDPDSDLAPERSEEPESRRNVHCHQREWISSILRAIVKSLLMLRMFESVKENALHHVTSQECYLKASCLLRHSSQTPNLTRRSSPQ